jgi:S-DNA-T family DNA segregation ATPase FtsK/SpoIIIE
MELWFMSEPIYIDRPPRIQPELPFDLIEIPSPPDKPEAGYTQLIQVGLPLITIIGYVMVATVGGGGRSPMLLIPMALSVVASVGFSIYTFRQEQQKLAEMALAYTERLVELNKEMHNYQDMQRRFYRYNYPDRLTTFRIVENARREVEKTDRTLRSESRLWERRVSDEDFGVIRLGMGTLPSTVLYQLGEVENFDDPQVREAMKLEEDSKYVSDIPVIITMRDNEPEKMNDDDDEEEEEGTGARTPFTHALGIAGERDSVYQFVRSTLAHYLVFHGPMDGRLYIIANDKKEWSWTDYAPHCQGDEQNDYQCFVTEIMSEERKEVAFDEDDEGVIGEFLEGLRKTLATRKIKLNDKDGGNEGRGDARLPFLLVVIDLLDTTYDPRSPLNNLESDAAISFLLEEGNFLGAGVIFLVPERSKVPSRCTAVIEIERTTPATNARAGQNQTLHFRYAEVGVNTPRYVGAADYISKPEHMVALSQKLAGMEVRQGFGANLNSAVMFMDMMGYKHLDHLQEDAISKWGFSTQPEHANWLRAKLGFMSGNKPRTLTFSAKKDGVHGMVAGSTGSGKSELLISLIIAMAVTYSPTVLNFVLVDYKGGGAFKEFAGLPHCVDIITNLEGDAVTRMFTAITSEMQRRQALNAETGTKNIVEYRKKGLHLTHKPYPFLFIIIDEFAEMISDRSEYKDELESITRVGRAQGVSLILAAQRPSGVTDQMRSNIKYRISLRVETPGESREMLRRSDAAFLPSGIPGRGYLQVGNEELELVQVAYSGEKYVDPDRAPRAKVIWPERGDVYDESADQEPPELYKVIIGLLDKLSRDNDVEQQRAPWPEFLPTQIALPQLLISNNPRADAITSSEYLANVDEIMLGQKPDETLTLNPSVNKWLNGENGWLARQNWDEYAVRPVVGLVDNPYAAQQLPLTINLPRGHVVAFGASGWGKTTFIRSLIVSLAATHSPEHLHMYILDLGGRNLAVLENLPHVGSVIIPDEEGYEERVEQLLRMLDEIVDARKTTLSNASTPDIYRYNELHPDAPLPAVIVAIDNFVEFKETFGNQNDNVESILDKFVDLARQAKSYGIHFVITAARINELSNKMFSIFTERLTFKLADPTEYRPIVGGQVADIGDIPGRGYMKIGHLPLSLQVALAIAGQADDGEEFNENKELEEYAKSMQQVIDSSNREYNLPMRVDALPKTILFKQILARKYDFDLDEQFMDRLEQRMRLDWRNSVDADQADWLSVVIGVISGNRLRNMEFEAKKDGVHGMIAGGTGSGKSELLMTLIVGLALRYDPTVLNFVLVDYKGGGAFKPFEKLPHCVDTITNLE